MLHSVKVFPDWYWLPVKLEAPCMSRSLNMAGSLTLYNMVSTYVLILQVLGVRLNIPTTWDSRRAGFLRHAIIRMAQNSPIVRFVNSVLLKAMGLNFIRFKIT
ncbi:hypothetical protein H9L39_09464 [Fusarium oxysporum f. sp. albedinis]|nr:hypothetical protein H9L39_09464 [Fusarium oxysporum f. sp. albedinis]